MSVQETQIVPGTEECCALTTHNNIFFLGLFKFEL